jgi:hypothetical protein
VVLGLRLRQPGCGAALAPGVRAILKVPIPTEPEPRSKIHTVTAAS